MSDIEPWIRQLESVVIELDEKPQFGEVGEFPWEKVEKQLQTLFEKSDLSLSHESKGWIPKEKCLEGMGKDAFVTTLFLTPIDEPLYWIMDAADAKGLMLQLLGGEKRGSYFLSADYVEGFYSYTILEILSQIEKTEFLEGFSPRMGSFSVGFGEIIADEANFIVDVMIQIEGHTAKGRFLLTPTFRSVWKKKRAGVKRSLLTSPLSKKISVDVALEIGKTTLPWDEWKQVHTGDFLLLERCHFDPAQKNGHLILTLNKRPLFRAMMVEAGIKLQQYPLLEEGEARMDGEEDIEDEEDEDFFSELEEEEKDKSDEEFDEILRKASMKKEEEEEGELGDITDKKAPSMAPTEITPLKPEKLPVCVTIEVGRLRMSIEELMQLTPGNLLKLPVTPEQGVDLVVNGKKVGRGELLKVGDVLGVRVLEL